MNTISISDLRSVISGQVITPEDAAYDKARTVFYGGIDRRPAFIVRPNSASDVQHAVAMARESGLEVAVRSGGHSMAGFSVTEGGIVIDMANMRDLQIDPQERTAWAEAGLTAGEYTTQAAAHGLATGFGDTGSVGIGGITLGGGVGYLVRKYGLTIDSLLAAEIVTADGQHRYVDESHSPDLFWAIRGGGGNFGVVTRFKYRLHPVEQVVGGMLLLPATPEVIDAYMALSEAAPEELSSIANIMPSPPMPFVPKEWHGKLILMAVMVYAGPVEEGQRALAPFRAITTPIADMLRPMTYPEIYPPEEGAGEFHPIAAAHNMFMDSFDRRAAETIIEHLQNATAMMAVTQLRMLGGAMARVPADPTAYAHRSRKIMVNLAALYGNPAQKDAQEAWVANFARALNQGRPNPGAYVNFVGDEGPQRVREAYPNGTYERLAAVKARYDPTNLFHLNHNIQPSL